MAIGDAATAAGFPLVDGATTPANTIDDEINRTRDLLAERTSNMDFAPKVHKHSATDITSGTLPVARGGTGRANVGSSAASNVGAGGLGLVAVRESDGVLFRAAGALAPGYIPKTLTFDNIFLPSSTAATSSYTVAYINGDGRVSRGASSERYKEQIERIDPAQLGDLWPDLHRFQMIDGDGTWKYGYIAEHLAESDDLHPFVVYAEHDDELVPDSIDFIALLIAQNAQLHQRVAALEAKHDD